MFMCMCDSNVSSVTAERVSIPVSIEGAVTGTLRMRRSAGRRGRPSRHRSGCASVHRLFRIPGRERFRRLYL